MTTHKDHSSLAFAATILLAVGILLFMLVAAKPKPCPILGEDLSPHNGRCENPATEDWFKP